MPPPPGYLSADGIDLAVNMIASAHPTFVDLLEIGRSSDRRPIYALKIGKGRTGVALVGGTHAREVINPDLLVWFAANLAGAYEAGAGLNFGSVTKTPETVQFLVDGLAIYVVPMLNPDGRAHVFDPAGYNMWRKTRNRNPGSPCRGVDLNRHFDLLWSSGIGTSPDPCPVGYSGFDTGEGTYKGRQPMRQPEARALANLLDEHSNIRCVMDIHSYSECVLYPWGHSENQTSDPSMNFRNPAWDGIRVNESVYREYIDPEDLYEFRGTADAIVAAIQDVRGRTYKATQGWHFIGNYRTSGTIEDWAYSRHLADPSKPRVLGYSMETGNAAENFQPNMGAAGQIIEEVSNGLMAFLGRCLCPIDVIIRRLLGSGRRAQRMTRSLQNFRDQHLKSSPRGRTWVAALEENGFELLAAAESDPKSRQALADLVVSAAEVVESWDTKRPRSFSPELIKQARTVATRIKRSHPQLAPVVDALRPDLKLISGRTPIGVVRRISKKR